VGSWAGEFVEKRDGKIQQIKSSSRHAPAAPAETGCDCWNFLPHRGGLERLFGMRLAVRGLIGHADQFATDGARMDTAQIQGVFIGVNRCPVWLSNASERQINESQFFSRNVFSARNG
jgi:hypothetical protein